MGKRKWLLVILAAVLALVLLLRFCFGNVWSVETDFEASEYYSVEDIACCADLAKRHFFRNFERSELLNLSYDAEFNEEFAPYEAERMGRSEAIILHSDWVHRGQNGPVEQGYIYTEWKWIFTRSPEGVWELVNYGYG